MHQRAGIAWVFLDFCFMGHIIILWQQKRIVFDTKAAIFPSSPSQPYYSVFVDFGTTSRADCLWHAEQ